VEDPEEGKGGGRGRGEILASPLLSVAKKPALPSLIPWDVAFEEKRV